MAWKCEECNMAFDNQELFDTHKRKFCVGSTVDPVSISSRLSVKQGNRNLHIAGDSPQTVLPEIKTRLQTSLSAPNTPYRPKHPVPDSDFRSLISLSSQQHQSLPNTPRSSEYGQRGLSALEREKIEQLKKFKTLQQLQRNARNLEDNFSLSSIKDNQLLTTGRFTGAETPQIDDRAADERILQLTENHRQQLAELKIRNERLQEEKMRIAERMNTLGLKSRQKIPSEGSLHKQAEELDGLKRYLDYKEEQERKKFNSQQSKVNVLKVPSRSPPSTAMSAVGSLHSHLRMPRIPSKELGIYRPDQPIPYYNPAMRYVDQAPEHLGHGSILQELNMLKNDYFQKGGRDPVILAQMRDLEFEAQRIQASQRIPPPLVQDPLLQQQITSFHTANQRLEQELQLLREERNKTERMRSPDIDPEFKRMKEDHLVKMASLRQEAELLKQQAEVEKVRKELKELRGETVLLEDTKKSSESPFMISNASANKDLLSSPYDPNAGFAVYWDFVLGLSASLTRCRLAAAIYQGMEIVTDVKLLPLVRTMPVTKDSHPTIPPGRVGVIGVKHPFPRCLPDRNFCLVVELQANSAEESEDSDVLVSKGWTKIDLFDISNRLLSGRWKIPFRIAPIKAFLKNDELNTIPQVGQAELYIRLVNSRDLSAQDALNPQPMQHFMYNYPPVGNVHVIPPVQHHRVSRVDDVFAKTSINSPPPPSVFPPPDTPLSSVHRAESTPRTPLEKSVVGFQVDKLMNAIPGEAKIKITVYEHEQGEMLKSENNKPVVCVTRSAFQDFLEGIYSFGLQEAQFKNVPWDANSIVVFRVYLHPTDIGSSGNATAQSENLLLAAWTALPLALTAGSGTPRRSRSQSRETRDSRRNSLRLNVGSHDIPLFFPPVVDVPNIPLRGPFPEQWTPYGQASLKISIFNAIDSPPERPSSPEEFVHENELPENVWIKNGRSFILTGEFEEGNGFDLYIDGARFLPDNITVSKVAGRVLDKNYTRLGSDIDIQAGVNADIYNPEYNARFEYREPVFPPSTMLMLKLYTVDRVTKDLCCVGCAFLPIFLEVGTTNQPAVDGSSSVKVALNEGPHQVRLYGGSPDFTQPLHESVIQRLCPVPCASLLVRIVQAACHPNGRPKEASEFKEADWEAEGLFQPKPNYADGTYFSLSCEPTLGECQIFHSMVKRQAMKTKDAIKLIGDGQERKLKKDKVIESWIKTRLTRNIDALPLDMDLNYVALYHVMHGLKISVDAAQNLPWGGFTMATYCLSPPGWFYKGERTDPLNYVTTPLYSSSIASPVWRQGLKVFPRRTYHRYMVIIIHLHELVVDTSQVKISCSLQGQAWTAVQVFNEGYVMGGSYLLPLYSGEPPEAVINSLQSENCVNVLASFRRRKVIKFVEGSSVYVRLSDARRDDELPAAKTKVRQDYLPREKLDKYLTINPSSSLSSLVPRGMTEDEFTAEVTSKFKTLTSEMLASYQRDAQQQRT